MKSPFPGMDPFIESCGLWEEFHGHLIEKIYETVADGVPEQYVVRTSRRSYVELVESEGKDFRPFKPDVGVSEPTERSGARKATSALAEADTEEDVYRRALVSEEFREKFVEVYEPEEDGLRLVTCVEVLSPANKKKDSEGWRQYLRKRQALLLGEANLVELDLLRGGQKLPLHDPWPDWPYTLLICRRERAPLCQIRKAASLRPLPSLPIPLSLPDADLSIELQPLLDGIYARGRFFRAIDYGKPCRPALQPEEVSFLAGRVNVTESG